MKKRKSPQEISDEVLELKKLLPRVRRRTEFGDDNRQAIECQIAVLEEGLTTERMYDLSEDREWSEYATDSGLEAIHWRDGKSATAPHKDWLPLCGA